MPSLGRNSDAPPSREVIGREASLGGRDLLRSARSDDVTAVLSCTGPHIYDEVRMTNGVFVVLHHDDRVAQIAQMLQRRDQPLVVPLMQADGGFVEDVENAHEPRSDLGGKAYSLRFAAGKRCGSAFEREVVQAHVHQKPQAGANLFHDGRTYGGIALGKRQTVEESQGIRGGELADLVDVPAAHRDRQDLGAQAFAGAGGAGNGGEVFLVFLTLGSRTARPCSGP